MTASAVALGCFALPVQILASVIRRSTLVVGRPSGLSAWAVPARIPLNKNARQIIAAPGVGAVEAYHRYFNHLVGAPALAGFGPIPAKAGTPTGNRGSMSCRRRNVQSDSRSSARALRRRGGERSFQPRCGGAEPGPGVSVTAAGTGSASAGREP